MALFQALSLWVLWVLQQALRWWVQQQPPWATSRSLSSAFQWADFCPQGLAHWFSGEGFLLASPCPMLALPPPQPSNCGPALAHSDPANISIIWWDAITTSSTRPESYICNLWWQLIDHSVPRNKVDGQLTISLAKNLTLPVSRPKSVHRPTASWFKGTLDPFEEGACCISTSSHCKYVPSVIQNNLRSFVGVTVQYPNLLESTRY